MSLPDFKSFKYYMFKGTNYSKVHSRLIWSNHKNWILICQSWTESFINKKYYEVLRAFNRNTQSVTNNIDDPSTSGEDTVKKHLILTKQRKDYLYNMNILQDWLLQHKIYTKDNFDRFPHLTNIENDEIWNNYILDSDTVVKCLNKINLNEYQLQQKDYIRSVIQTNYWNPNSAYLQSIDRAKTRKYWTLYNYLIDKPYIRDNYKLVFIEASQFVYNIIQQLTRTNFPEFSGWNKKHITNQFVSFIDDFMNIIHGSYPKINSLCIYGKSNCGKTELIQLLTNALNTTIMTNVGDGGTFHFSNIGQPSTIILGNETSIRSSTIEQWKNLLAGEPCTVPLKYKNHQKIERRIPIFLTSNNHPTQTISNTDDLEAINNRLIVYHAQPSRRAINHHVTFPNKLLPLKDFPHLTLYILRVLKVVWTKYKRSNFTLDEYLNISNSVYDTMSKEGNIEIKFECYCFILSLYITLLTYNVYRVTIFYIINIYILHKVII